MADSLAAKLRPMGADGVYTDLLAEVRLAYCAHPSLVEFARFPDRLQRQDFVPHHRSSCDQMRADRDLTSAAYPCLTSAIQRAGPSVQWRETYKEDAGGAAFMSRWGCFTVIGTDSPFASTALRIFVVYMPAGLYYPSHRHPADEIYLVVAGRAIFRRAGAAAETLREGQTMFHAGHEVHAIETTDSPVLCLVAWRNHLDTPPVLVEDRWKPAQVCGQALSLF